MASADEREEMAKRYREGGVGYGDVKKRIVELFFETFCEARERRQELESNPEMLREIYAEGGRRARAKAREVLERAREAAGIGRGL